MIELILGILGVLSPLVTAYLTFSLKIKLRKMELAETSKKDAITTQIGELKGAITQINNTITQINKDLQAYIKDNKFRKKFKNTIRSKATHLCILYKTVFDANTRDILMKWSELIEKFGLDFYYSEQRKATEDKREKYLTSRLNILINDLYLFTNDLRIGQKIYEGQSMSASKFLKKLKLHSETEMLKLTLIKNGLTSDDMLTLFEDYITNFAKDLLDISRHWDKLPIVE